MAFFGRRREGSAAPAFAGAGDRASSAAVDELFAREIEPILGPLGFVAAGRRKWVRDRHAPIRHVIEVQELKGAVHSPVWYLSLDFAPHLTSTGTAFHRTNKHVRPDLRYDPIDYLEGHPGLQSWTVDGLGRPAEMREQTRALAAWTTPLADAWLNEACEVGHLPAAFERANDLPYVRFGMKSYSQQLLAWPFALSAAGLQDEAQERLAAFISSRSDLSTEQRDSLEKALRDVGTRTPTDG